MQTQRVSAQHKTSTYIAKFWFNVDHFQAVYTTSSPSNTGIHRQYNTQYMSTGNIEVLSWFLESVPPRLLAVNVIPYGTKALSSMVL